MRNCGQYVYSLRTTSWIKCVPISTDHAALRYFAQKSCKTHSFFTTISASFTRLFQQPTTHLSPLYLDYFSTVSTPPTITTHKEKKG